MWSSGSDGDRNVGPRKIDAPIAFDAAARHQAVYRVCRKHHEVERLTCLDAARHLDAAR